jgi:hypothetical protein
MYCTVYDFSLLLTGAAVERSRDHATEFSNFLLEQENSGEPIRVYPDGTLQVDGAKSYRFWNFLVGAELLGTVLTNQTMFRSLAPFRPRLYRLVYTHDYSRLLGGEADFVAGSADGKPELPGERVLDDLGVTVVFRRRASREVMKRLATVIREWARTVSNQGMFGEGPASLVSPQMAVDGRQASFRVNVESSGQNTLNWLILTILQFGHEVAPVHGVLFADEDSSCLLGTGSQRPTEIMEIPPESSS